MRKFIVYKILCFLCIICCLVGCGKQNNEHPKELAICSSMNKELTELLVDSYSKAYGIKVYVNYLPGGTQQERFDYLRQHKFGIQ